MAPDPELTALFDDLRRNPELAARAITLAAHYRLSLPRHQDSTQDAGGVADTVGWTGDSPPRVSGGMDAAPAVGGYQITGELGRGGMGVVYRAQQVGLKRTVALKVVLGGAHAGAEQLARFRAEAEAAARLKHPHIVQIYDIGEHAGLPYFSLEYVEGGNLAQRLAGTPLSPQEAARLADQLACAVHAAHECGIVHRDLKPANVLLTADGTPKISDFGLAKLVQGGEPADVHTRTGDILGTPSYMAPEQAAGRVDQISPPTDVYALGAILYEMLVGRPPYRAATALETVRQVLDGELVSPRLLNPVVPRDLETIAVKCLEREPARRYATAQALADELQRFLDGRPILARPVGSLERLLRWARRNRRTAALSSAVAALLVLLAAGSLTAALVLNDARNKERAALTEETAAKEAARRAVDNYVTSVMNDDLLRDERFQPLRKTLLADALAYYQDFIRQQRHDAASRRALAQAYGRMQQISYTTGSWNEALAAAEQAVDLLEELAAQNPRDAELMLDLVHALEDLAVVQDGLGRPQQAEATVQRALAIIDSLPPGDAGHERWVRLAASCRHALSLILNTLGRGAEALDSVQRAISLQEQLAAGGPDQLEDQAKLAGSHGHRGQLLVRLGRFPEAIAAHQRALEIRRLIADREPTLQRQTQLGQGHINLGLMLLTIGDRRAAGELEQAIAVFEKAAADYPNVAEGKSMLAAAHSNAGLMHEQQGALDAAAASYRQALSLYEGLLVQNPQATQFRRGVALNCRNLGEVERARRAYDDALACHQRALEHYRELAALEDRTLEDQRGVAGSLETLGLTHLDRGDLERALSCFRDSLQITQGMLAEFPDDLMCRSDIGNSYNNQGWTLHAAGRHAEAIETFRKGLPFQQQVLRQAPQAIQFRFALSNHYDGLIESCLALKRHEEAFAACLERKQLFPADAERLYEVAALVASCLPPVGAAASRTADEESQWMNYADLALETLREALGAGLDDRQRLRTDPALEPLRKHPEFDLLAPM